MTPLERLKKHREEQDYCYAVLDLWGLVKAAGYSWEQVRAFSFRHKFFTKEERRKHGHDRVEFGKWWHNCFILHDGTEIQIPLTDRPYDPCKSR
jgi:hypothetical protein